MKTEDYKVAAIMIIKILGTALGLIGFMYWGAWFIHHIFGA